MTDWTGQDYLNELAGRQGASAPATLGEIWNAEWQRAGLDTISGVGKPYADATADLESAIAGASGRDVTDYAFSQGINLAGAASPDDRAALLGQVADSLPDDKRKAIDPLKDVRRRAAEKAQKIEADAADTAASTYGLSGVATAWLAGLARQTIDPVNLAAMGITAPIGGAEAFGLKFMLRQGASGAAAQALVEPGIEPARAELGLDSGLGRAAGNIAEAGIGGSVLAGLLHGAGAAIRLARGRRPDIGEPLLAADAALPPRPVENTLQESAVPEAGPVSAPPSILDRVAPEELAAAARIAERDHVIDAAAPEGAREIHGEAVVDAGNALEQGRPLAAPAVLADRPLRVPEVSPEPVVAEPEIEAAAAPAASEAVPALKPEPAVAAEPAPIGDPQLAAAATRALAAQPDLTVHMPDGEGGFRRMPAREVLAAVDDEGHTAAEFAKCASG